MTDSKKQEAEQAPAAEQPIPDPTVAVKPGTAPGKDDTPARVRVVPSDWMTSELVFADPFAKPDADGYVPTVSVTADEPGRVPFYVDAGKADEFVTAAAGHGFAVQKETTP